MVYTFVALRICDHGDFVRLLVYVCGFAIVDE